MQKLVYNYKMIVSVINMCLWMIMSSAYLSQIQMAYFARLVDVKYIYCWHNLLDGLSNFFFLAVWYNIS